MAGFMKIDGIDGESTDSKHDKWIVIQSLSAAHTVRSPKGPTACNAAADRPPFKTSSWSAKWTNPRSSSRKPARPAST